MPKHINNVVREDSQIDFAVGGGGGGGGGRGVLCKKVSHILAIIDFFKKRNSGKILSARKNVICNISSSCCLNLENLAHAHIKLSTV